MHIRIKEIFLKVQKTMSFLFKTAKAPGVISVTKKTDLLLELHFTGSCLKLPLGAVGANYLEDLMWTQYKTEGSSQHKGF
jgi:hypothetical protein